MMKITPDIAELIATYKEGGSLSASENGLVEELLKDGKLSANLLEDVTPFPDLQQDFSFAEDDIPTGMMAMDTMDLLPIGADDHTSIIGEVTPFPGVSEYDIIQHQSDTCAIKAQQIILHTFGFNISEEALTLEATTKGYYTPGQGSYPMDIGNLLEDHGVGTHTKLHANVYDLMLELAQGHKIIVGVDADELWHPSFYNDLFGENANHALVVTGIDTSNPYDTRVILTDPGTGDVARSYPINQFLDAWHDSACFMVATDEAPALSYPNGIYNHEMINFDYSLGHIPSIGNIPYDIFAYTMVPRMDDYFDNQLPHLLTEEDWLHTFDHMYDTYDSFDGIVENELANHGNSWDDIDFDNMFDSLMI
jgi:hypothetical protein